MKRFFSVGLLAVTGIALTGCSTISFLYPLAADSADLAAEVDISGKWMSGDKDRWTFERRPEGTYAMTWANDKEKLELEASVVRLSNFLFLDVSSKEEGTAIRGHHFALLRVESGTLQVAWLDGKWMERKLAKERALPYELPCSGKEKRCYVVTAGTADVQNFLLRHALDTEAFGDVDTLHRD